MYCILPSSAVWGGHVGSKTLLQQTRSAG